MASGVLPICLGEATKLAQFLLDADKEYEATLCFGVETDTFDATGAVTAAARRRGDLTRRCVERALAAFRGPIRQVPPRYSALKLNGRPLYDYARAGEEVEPAPRTRGDPRARAGAPGPTRPRSCCACAARRGPTSARWRSTWAGRWAPART